MANDDKNTSDGIRSWHMDPHGDMVPCENTPCSRHGGGDIMAASREDAYSGYYERNPQNDGLSDFSGWNDIQTRDNVVYTIDEEPGFIEEGMNISHDVYDNKTYTRYPLTEDGPKTPAEYARFTQEHGGTHFLLDGDQIMVNDGAMLDMYDRMDDYADKLNGLVHYYYSDDIHNGDSVYMYNDGYITEEEFNSVIPEGPDRERFTVYANGYRRGEVAMLDDNANFDGIIQSMFDNNYAYADDFYFTEIDDPDL